MFLLKEIYMNKLEENGNGSLEGERSDYFYCRTASMLRSDLKNPSKQFSLLHCEV